jgi:hypothetical protein
MIREPDVLIPVPPVTVIDVIGPVPTFRAYPTSMCWMLWEGYLLFLLSVTETPSNYTIILICTCCGTIDSGI